MRILGKAILFLVALSQLGSTDCGGDAIRDSGFDLWCGDQLCAWKVERGEARRVATWNKGDSGVELVGSDAAIEQLSPYNSHDGTCLKFQLVANIDPNAEVYLNVDLEGDGTIEMTERLPSASWRPLSYTFSMVPLYDGIRFELTKRGAGTAVLANISAKAAPSSECTGLVPLDPGPRRPGAACREPADCASMSCGASVTPIPSNVSDYVCGGCSDPCPTGTVCGLGDPLSAIFAVPSECVAIGAKPIGALCVLGDECGSSRCENGVCSACASNTDCAVGACVPSAIPADAPDWVRWHPQPMICGGDHTTPSAVACGNDLDCASGSCTGAPRGQCWTDGRSCLTSADCPFQGLLSSDCFIVGVEGGSCQ